MVTNQRFIERNQENQENQELDELTRKIVTERDQERLKQMTYYCFTRECLRDYILRYFGEYGENYCGNCSNCLSQFETVDVTAEAKALAECVKTSRQRYGILVILDTVHGANTAKIRQYRMNENPCYGALAKVSAHRLRQIFNHLLLEGYLKTTSDEYMLVKLTELTEVLLDGKVKIEMKMAKEQEPREKVTAKKKKKTAGVLLSNVQQEVFEKLRQLRMEIAKEEKVPPYIVFSDKTLVHMSVEKPQDKAGMLEITGVGEFKYQKYGERFLEALKSC